MLLLGEQPFSLAEKKASVEKSQRNTPREEKKLGEDRNIIVFSMIKLVPLFRRTDLNLLLCNHKDLFFLRVYKLLDCFSPKSMWFLWNIFSKGSHMLQCLCGKSLKKNKNPTGKRTIAMRCFSLMLPCLLLAEVDLQSCSGEKGGYIEASTDMHVHTCMNKQGALCISFSPCHHRKGVKK